MQEGVLIVAKRNFSNDDKLGRLGYAKFIEILLFDTKKYKRDDDTNSFVLALDSPWGTGKTYFIEMLYDYLENSAELDVQFNVFKYNAWQNDFWDNAFEPLMHTFLSDDKFVMPNKNRLNSLASKLKICIPSIAKGILIQPIRLVAGEKAAEDTRQTIDTAVDWFADINSIFPDYQIFTENIKILKDVLAEYVELIGHSRRLVIIIDELDRCKPTFAIQTLEIVKHLFDVEGISFVFSLDIQQLSHSIKCVYGNGMDSVGYIMRFFDYIFKMPTPDIKSFIQNTIEGKPIKLEHKDLIEFIDNFLHITRFLNLSLRDITTIYTSFLALVEFELVDNPNVILYYNYLALLCLKYKAPTCFEALMLGKANAEHDNIIKNIFRSSSEFRNLIRVNDFLSKINVSVKQDVTCKSSIKV